jgi:hypothetical protein
LPPPKEEIESWLPEQALTLQVGALALQGALIHGQTRLAFDFPLVPRIPAHLPPARRAWLQVLLADGQRRWRMVRIGIQGDAEAHAEVDLSGAPHASLEPLARVGLDALRHVVSSLVEPADFLVHGAHGCRAVEVPPDKPRRRRRRRNSP